MKTGVKELEMYVKKAGIWEKVSGLNITRLTKLIEIEKLDKGIKGGLLKFAEKEDENKA